MSHQSDGFASQVSNRKRMMVIEQERTLAKLHNKFLQSQWLWPKLNRLKYDNYINQALTLYYGDVM